MLTGQRQGHTKDAGSDQPQLSPPAISLPKGGGAIRGIGEKFAANPVTGTGSMTVPLAASPGRSGFGPQLALSYDSGAGNGPFGFGWSLSLPSITRKTDKGLPQYLDADESDVFILSGAEDLVPELRPDGSRFNDQETVPGYTIHRYRPRIEGLFARIERWTRQADGDVHWRSFSTDNILTLYGKDDKSRIADPADPSHVFSWLMCETRDDKGNAVMYEYTPEDGAGVDLTQAHEHNRGDRNSLRRTANRYLKRIRYGNRNSLLTAEGRRPPFVAPSALQNADWMFEVVFDYGEHHPDDPKPDDAGAWLCRNDPFSSYRAGFEVRIYRLCQRVLMFHHFPGEAGVRADCLVRSTDFVYRDIRNNPDDRTHGHPIASFIAEVSQSGYTRADAGGYLKKSLPPLEFEYSAAVIGQDIHDVDPASMENLPSGTDGAAYQWVDLDGEGLSGVLTEQGGGWFYKRNESARTRNADNADSEEYAARFAPIEQVARIPAGSPPGHWQFLDLAGDGQVDRVALDQPVPGFYERTHDQDWQPFRAFRLLPNLAWNDPNLKFVDLTGDGHADVLITEDQVFTWYPSLAEEGFGPATRVSVATDEEQGPHVVFADGTQTISLADLSGDGLTDIVRIRNGEVCYWPNLSYGRFGAKVTMDDAPWFDAPDQFDPRRIRLADIDGSGVTDIIYLGRNRTRFWFNQAGNAWSQANDLPGFPPVDNIASVAAVDLLGNGTACLVWSSPLPGARRAPMQYLNLMAEGKPHLMVRTLNNLGAETRVHYAPSTHFYLQDKYAGQPWLTKLPFPVHVVERVETDDRISRNRFVTRYAYHHGYFDGVEREFRGFGMVEQFDTEEFAALSASDTLAPIGGEGGGEGETATNIDAASHVPPVHTKTWFHTGVYLGRDHVSDFFAGLLNDQDKGDYYREPGLTEPQARELLLDDTVLPNGLTVEEEREACRALKGAMLRQEVYALDGTDKAEHPYTVTEQNFAIRLLQERGDNRHTVFFTHAREAVSYHYERNPDDPRVQHALTLEVDSFGNVLKSAAIGYGRRIDAPDAAFLPEDREKQRLIHITCTENTFTNPIVDKADVYRTPLPAETRTYELRKPQQEKSGNELTDLYHFDTLLNHVNQAGDGKHDIDYEDLLFDKAKQAAANDAGEGKKYFRRLIEQVRTLYRPDDMGATQNDPKALLPLAQMQALALPGESYKLAFTPGLLDQVYVRSGQKLLSANPADVLKGGGADRGGYVLSQDWKAAGFFPDTDPDDHWWIPAGRVFLSPNSGDTAAQELAYARQHFFLPHRYRDPFHTTAVSTESFVSYDAYDLLMVATRDALGNVVTVATRDDTGNTAIRIDYRVLQPYWVTDPNGNRTRVAFDALGMVVGTAVMGKPLPAPVEGDSLDAFKADLTEAVILDHLQNPLADPQAMLQRATTRLMYDLFAYHRTKDQASPQPAVVYILVRETHDSDPVPAGGLKIQHSFSYSDGFGREIQKKIQAEAGPVPQRDANGKIIVETNGQPMMTSDDVSPRWVGSGWTVFNNKGKPVRQYEPFFTDTHRFEFDVRIGVSPVLFYDPVERVIATLHPNHTYEKVVFDPWRQKTWDVNDTIQVPDNPGDPLFDPKNDPDVGHYFGRLPDDAYLPTWYDLRTDAAKALEAWPDSDADNVKRRTAEKSAADKASVHAHTPTTAHLDTLGRPFLTVAINRFERKKPDNTTEIIEEPPYHTRVELDIEGNQREVIDAKDRVVMRYDYDMLGSQMHQASMEAGERWMLNDVSGKPLYAWDSRDHQFCPVYDPLRRPTDTFLLEGTGPERRLIGRTVYGETQPNPEAKNLRGKPVQLFDQAGGVTSDDYDFKGNLLSSQRQLAQAYNTTLNWPTVPLEANIYTSRTRYDALNRPTELTTPHTPAMQPSVIRPGYNEANLLERVEANLRGVAVATPFVTDIDYDAKGQRTLIDYGNGVRTTYEYDPLTHRLAHLKTLRGAARLQDLFYTYDPAGNITFIRDDAQQTIYFNNRRVEPSADYTYDAIYRLIEATGREHLGQIGGQPNPPTAPDALNSFHTHLDHRGNGNAMGTFSEQYVYDAVGNFLEMQHRGRDPVHTGWTRTYAYNQSSLVEPGKKNNRLSTTTLQPNGNQPIVEPYTHDVHGNMTSMPHLSKMEYDFQDQLQATSKQVVNNGGTPEITHYVYDAGGQRVRKVTERQAAAGVTPKRMKERIYLGGFEIYREYESDGDTVTLERETFHIMDDQQRIALVETRTQGTPGSDLAPAQLIRYQFGNHLGSASLELDDQARIISYEEYYPYGSTSYQAVRSQTETPKRYRYTGMERDEETGFSYHGARYYAPWLGRWLSTDPIGVKGDINLFCYSGLNPLVFSDKTGLQPEPTEGPPDAGIPVTYAARTRDDQIVYHVSEAELNSGVTGFIRNEVGPRVVGGFQVLAGASGFAFGAFLSRFPGGGYIGVPLMVLSADVAGSGLGRIIHGSPQPTVVGQVFGPKAQELEENVVNAAGFVRPATEGYTMWKTGKPLIPNSSPPTTPAKRAEVKKVEPPAKVSEPAPPVSSTATATTQPQRPQMHIRYTDKMATTPSDAQFLRFNAEWAQQERRFLTLGTRNPVDSALRGWARRWMDKSKFSRTGLQAMHPLDSAINPWVQSGIPGRTYYFGSKEVNLSFGGQIGAEIRRLNLKLGDEFTIHFHGYPSYGVVPPTAPSSSPPNR